MKVEVVIIDDLANDIQVNKHGDITITIRPPAKDRGAAYVKLNPEDGRPYTVDNYRFFMLVRGQFLKKYNFMPPEDHGYREATQHEIKHGRFVDEDHLGG